jgi:hypothetical protein
MATDEEWIRPGPLRSLCRGRSTIPKKPSGTAERAGAIDPSSALMALRVVSTAASGKLHASRSISAR